MRELQLGLWSGDHVFEDAENIEYLRSKGRQYSAYMVVQSLMSGPKESKSSCNEQQHQSRADYRKKLDGLGIPATVVCNPECNIFRALRY